MIELRKNKTNEEIYNKALSIAWNTLQKYSKLLKEENSFVVFFNNNYCLVNANFIS